VLKTTFSNVPQHYGQLVNVTGAVNRLPIKSKDEIFGNADMHSRKGKIVTVLN
jgi:hypothetical protein